MADSFRNAEQIFDYIHQEVKRTFNIDLTRRDFMKLVSGGMLGAVATGLKAKRSQAQTNVGDAMLSTTPTLPNGIASGDVTATSAILWTRSTVVGDVRFTVFDESDTQIAEATASVTEPMQPIKVLLDGLNAGTAYRYQVTDSAESTLEGTFRTFAEAGFSGLRFGVSGDWRGELRPYVGVANVPERDLDFFVALGDTIYADYPSIALPKAQARTLDDFRIKHSEIYTERFGKNFWATIRASTALFASIDDHEVVDNFAGGAIPDNNSLFADEGVAYVNQSALYQNGLQAFREYHPIAENNYSDTNDPIMEGRPNLYRYRRAGNDAAFFILDARSFRDVPIASVQNFLSGSAIDAWRQSAWQTGRTMLGQTQFDTLQRDLVDAQSRGIVWKFIMMPEPVQQTGWFAGEDRWEGYAPERTEILQFIEREGITNVVFVSADIHSTLISALSYQTSVDSEQIPTSIWEISTGSVGFYPPTGQGAIEFADNFGVLLPYEADRYDSPDITDKDDVLESIFNRFVLSTQGLSPLGLENSGIEHELLQGGWAIGHSFGWTEFDIDAELQTLTVTTYGLEAYSANDMTRHPENYVDQLPRILGQMRIMPTV